jgi:hypothetical protein
MVPVRGLSCVLMIALFGVGSALAQPAPAPAPGKAAPAALIGATEVVKLTPPAGFIDDPVAADDQRIAYVVAETGSKAELHVYSYAIKAEQVVDLSAVTLHPVAIQLVGARAFVVGVTEDGSQVAALVELADKGKGKPPGAVVYKLGPATHITAIMRDGKQRVAIHKATASASGTRHDVELVAIETGKRIAAGRPLELDSNGKQAKLELTVNHWSDGMTRAYGIKAGAWDRKEDQRSPDTEATYDLITGKLETKKIDDLYEQRRRFQALADAGNQLDFVRMAWDNSGLQLWKAGRSKPLAFDEPLANYDPKSLQAIVTADGGAWIVLKIDPVNPAAVERKKADPEYLDIFRAGADGKALRKTRVLAKGVRHRFGLIALPGGDKFWLLERNKGMDRGGNSLTVYQP